MTARSRVAAWLAALVFLLGPGGLVQAAEPGEVQSVLECLKVTAGRDGKETFAEADQARRGDLLEYRLTYTNHTGAAVSDLAATLPLPAGTVYLLDSARPASAQASLDGRQFHTMPLMEEVPSAKGPPQKRRVPLEKYRYLRWKVAVLEPGAPVTLVARVKVQ